MFGLNTSTMTASVKHTVYVNLKFYKKFKINLLYLH